jgi:hypothetical protein
MAILPGAPGFKVEVLVNGSVAQEYSGDEVADPNTTTKYIEAISGAPFRVAYSINSEHSTTYVGEGVKVRVYLDGKEVFGRLIRAQPDFDGKRRYCNGAENHYFQKSYLERFRFSEFKIGMY